LRAEDIEIDTIGYHCKSAECSARAHSEISHDLCCVREFQPFLYEDFLTADPTMSYRDWWDSVIYGSEIEFSEEEEGELADINMLDYD